MTIPDDIVRKLNGLLIEDVAGALGITVTKHKARCFMHDDHRPSLTFNSKKNMFFCFVCNKGGGPIQLVQEHEGLAFKEACIWLANCFNIWRSENDEPMKTVRRRVKRIYLPKKEEMIGEFDEELYTWLIENAKLSEQAKRFLFEERRFKEEVIERLNIKSVTFPKMAIAMLIGRFGEKRCLKSGLLKKGQYGLYFYFYTPCLLFPYYEKDGRLVGVQSRYLGEIEDAPRFQFLSLRKTRLFNLPILNTLKRGDKLFISEGITDCMALLSSGQNAVAIPSATILPLEDLVTLRSYDLHMFPDQDEAGQKAFVELRRFFVNHYAMLRAEKLPEGAKDYCDYYRTSLQNKK